MADEYSSSDDAWGDEKLPGLSFKKAAKGQALVLKVNGPAKTINRRDFDTGEIAKYDDGNNKKAVVFPVTVLDASDMWPIDDGDDEDANPAGEDRAYFINKPSQPYAELGKIARELRKSRGRALDAGDVIKVTLVDLKRKEGARKGAAPQKFYSFELVTEGSGTEDDPFDE
jgi:predicted heme/steroid binding protein